MLKTYLLSLFHVLHPSDVRLGSLTNPKIAVFMLAVLSSVLDPDLSSNTKWTIAIMGMTIDTIWYALVALSLSNSIILSKIRDNQNMLNKVTGLLMILLALWTGFRLIGQ